MKNLEIFGIISGLCFRKSGFCDGGRMAILCLIVGRGCQDSPVTRPV